MMTPSLLILLPGVLLLSAFFTGVLRRYALRHLLDHPNARSAHRVPTPRGGGMAIVLSFTGAAMLLLGMGHLPAASWPGLLAGVVVAAIGFVDDHRPLPILWRLGVHLGASAFVIMMSLWPAGSMVQSSVWYGLAGIIVLGALTWSLNLFNFMDGIDGLAGSEAVFVAGALAGLLFSNAPDLALLSALLALTSLGFLLWNWPPARIFMGDAGSGFLGFWLGLLILLAAQRQLVFLPVGLILYGVFVCDASLTLLTRWRHGEVWYHAHAQHAYQHAARQYGHWRVTCTLWGINLLWLLPLAYIAQRVMFFTACWLVIVAYAPLCVLARQFRAGQAPYFPHQSTSN